MGPCVFKSVSGFSLVELMIAMTIFAVGLLAVVSMQLTAIRGNSSANSLTTATAIAEGIIEEILAWSGDNPVFEVDDPGRSWIFSESDSSESISLAGAGTFQARYAIDADYGVSKLTRVQVTVSRPGGGQRQSVILVGFKRRT